MMGAGIILNIQTAGNLKLQTNGACITLTDLDTKKQSDNHVVSFLIVFLFSADQLQLQNSCKQCHYVLLET